MKGIVVPWATLKPRTPQSRLYISWVGPLWGEAQPDWSSKKECMFLGAGVNQGLLCYVMNVSPECSPRLGFLNGLKGSALCMGFWKSRLII